MTTSSFVREAVICSLRNDEKLRGSQKDKSEEVPGAALLDTKTKTIKKRRRLDSNWKQLQKTLRKTPLRNTRKSTKKNKEDTESEKEQKPAQLSAFMSRPVTETSDVTNIVAMDCEMVGVGPGGKQNALARVSIVNYGGDVLYDTFVQVKEDVIDYRTQWSGVRAEDIASESSAAVEPFEAQQAVGELIKDRVVVGHALRNDMKVLRVSHPWQDIRDTSVFFKKLWRKQGRRSGVGPKLSIIVAEVLGVDTFQKSEHDSCEDARAALALYKRHRKEWESSLRALGNDKNKKKKKKKISLKEDEVGS